MDRPALDSELLNAHSCNDLEALARLYTIAADEEHDAGNIDGACFYLTHAYVFALQAGLPEAHGLHKRLLRHGREERLPSDAQCASPTPKKTD